EAHDRPERDEGQHRGRDEALVERPHDVVGGPELDEEGADDRGHHTSPADRKRQHHAPYLIVAGKHDGGEHHGRDRGHHIGLEEIGRHAGTIADIVGNGDRKSTRLNSSHVKISYAVFCLKKKKKKKNKKKKLHTKEQNT